MDFTVQYFEITSKLQYIKFMSEQVRTHKFFFLGFTKIQFNKYEQFPFSEQWEQLLGGGEGKQDPTTCEQKGRCNKIGKSVDVFKIWTLILREDCFQLL